MAKQRNVLFCLCLCFCFSFIFESFGDLPDYWESEIADVADKVNRLSGVSFCFITDFHNKSNNGHSPEMLKEVMDRCEIKNYINGGDMATDGNYGDEQMTIEDLLDAKSKFADVPGAIWVEGNHDSAYSLTGFPYAQNLMPERIRETCFGGMDAYFSATGNYYYLDDEANRMRYIVLNSQDKTYVQNADGSAVDNKMWEFAFQQPQISWLAYWALDVPDDWSVIVASHVAPGENEQTGSDYPVANYDLVINILKAFHDKTCYVDVGTNGDYPACINVDYTGKGGDVICWVAGHSHADKLFKLHSVNIVVTLNDNQIDGQAFDVLTVDKTTRIVRVTRVGVGDDREFKY